MSKHISSIYPPLKAILHLILLLVITFRCSNSTTILTDDEGTLPPVLPTEPDEEPNVVEQPVADVVPTLSFFMHDILGGSAPSERVVAGLTTNANTQINTLPFSKQNRGRVFPLTGGIPLVKANRNLPTISGLNGQVPQGSATTLQKLMFGTITVIDDELTQGHDLGSSVIGKAQGFFLASSEDGNSHTMVFTTMFNHEGEDTISFFGVHRTVTNVSQLAIVGGTGKYVDAEGFAAIETLRLDDQHTTDGVDTILQFSVYLSH